MLVTWYLIYPRGNDTFLITLLLVRSGILVGAALHCMSDGSSLPIENLRSSLPACIFFFSINIPVPRLKFKNETESWDIHHARLGLKSARKTIEAG